jgi:dimethylamine monooxygenase subunit A
LFGIIAFMYFDFDASVSAPFRMQPGLRRLPTGAPQLTPLAPGSRHQREKLAVLSAFAEQALLAREGFDAAPALHALCKHAADEHPGAFAWDGARAQALRLGTEVAGTEVQQVAPGRFGRGDEVARCLHGLPPDWRLAGLLSLAFAEDLAIVDGADASIPWLAVALPSHWAPEEKVGRHFAEVHAPVADNALVVNAGPALMRMVTGPERWERFVWNVSAHPWLHAHPRRCDPGRWARTAVSGAWWRTERQTFIPLPERRQAVFTILVGVEPLTDAVAAPGRAAKLHDAIASMSPAVLDYRGLTPVREPLLAWLAERR